MGAHCTPPDGPGNPAEMASVRQTACASVCARVTVAKSGKRTLMLTVCPASPSAWRRAATCPAISCRIGQHDLSVLQILGEGALGAHGFPLPARLNGTHINPSGHLIKPETGLAELRDQWLL